MRRPFGACLCRGVLLLALAVFSATSAALSLVYPSLPIFAVALLAWKRTRRVVTSDVYGTARMARLSEFAPLLGARGPAVVLGRARRLEPPSRWRGVGAIVDPRLRSDLACETFFAAFYRTQILSDSLLRLGDFVHLNTVAPAGAGKSTRILIPNLRSYTGSCVVVDPKGELFLATAADRARMGQKVYRLDPYEVAGPGTDRLNPLDFLDRDSVDLVEECRDCADQLVDRRSTAKDPHWDESSYNVTAALLFLICHCPELRKDERTLQSLRDAVASEGEFVKAVGAMKGYGYDRMMRRLGGIASWFRDKELSSVVSTLHRHTGWLDTHRMESCLAYSTFDPRDLRSESGATLYLILPPDKLSVMSGLLRLWVGSILRRLTKPGAYEGKPPVLFLVDEAAQIGRMRALEESVTFLRGMGIRMWFFWQALDQMKACFENPSVVLANLATQQFFGLADYETAEAVSRRIGDETRTIYTSSTTEGKSTNYGGPGPQQSTVSHSTTYNTSEVARRLLKPEEILQLPADCGLLFHMNLPVMPTRLVPYFADRSFNGARPRTRRASPAAGGLAALTLGLSLGFAAAALVTIPLEPIVPYLVAGLRAIDPPAGRPAPDPPAPYGASSRAYTTRRQDVPRRWARIP